MIRHLQLARPRAGQAAIGGNPDPSIESDIRLDAESDPSWSQPSYELAVRMLCPFCGSDDASGPAPCCDQGTGGVDRAVAAPAAPRSAERAASGWSGWLGEGAPILAALFGSATIALSVSLTMSRLASDEVRDVKGAHLMAGEIASALHVMLDEEHADRSGIDLPVRPARPAAESITPPAESSLSTTIAVPPAPPAAIDAKVVANPVVEEAPSPPSVEPAARIEKAAAPVLPDPVPPAAGAPAIRPVIAVAAAVPAAPASSGWHALHRGMSRAAVRALLGDPRSVDHTKNVDFWLFSGESVLENGWVAFYDMDGPVQSWREP